MPDTSGSERLTQGVTFSMTPEQELEMSAMMPPDAPPMDPMMGGGAPPPDPAAGGGLPPELMAALGGGGDPSAPPEMNSQMMGQEGEDPEAEDPEESDPIAMVGDASEALHQALAAAKGDPALHHAISQALQAVSKISATHQKNMSSLRSALGG